MPKAVDIFLQRYHRARGHLPSILFSDNGPVNVSAEMDAVLDKRMIVRRNTVPHCSEQNPAERYIGIVSAGARANLHHSGRPMLLWGEAVKAFVYVMNRMPNSSNPGGVSPYEMEHSRKPDNSHFVEWGATVYSHLPHDGREMARPESLDAAAEVGIMVGYSTNTKGYRIYFPERGNKNQNGNILVRRHLKFFPPGNAPPDEGDEL